MITVAKVQRFSEQTKDFPKNCAKGKQKRQELLGCSCLLGGMDVESLSQLSTFDFLLQIAIDISGTLEIETRLGILQFSESLGVVEDVHRLGEREVVVFRQHGHEVAGRAFVHVVEVAHSWCRS